MHVGVPWLGIPVPPHSLCGQSDGKPDEESVMGKVEVYGKLSLIVADPSFHCHSPDVPSADTRCVKRFVFDGKIDRFSCCKLLARALWTDGVSSEEAFDAVCFSVSGFCLWKGSLSCRRRKLNRYSAADYSLIGLKCSSFL